MTKISPQPGILDIALYQGGKSHVDGVANPIKLSSNENPYGPSPKAIAALQAAAPGMHRYPSTDHAQLRAAIGEVHHVDPARVICGVGSDEILHLLCQAYVGPGDEVIHTRHGFAVYRICTLAAGGTPVEVPERNRHVDVDEILAAVTDRTRMVFVTNPGNPTATMLSEAEITRLAEGLPTQTLLVLDAAYAEFVEGFDGGAAFVEAHDNVVMTRTFSKLYGLGGLRVGWGYAAQHIIDVLNRIRGPFNLSLPALAAAEAGLRDSEYTAFCLSENARLRVWLAEQLAALGVPSDPSFTNFLLARFSSETEANACYAHLLQAGLIVRQMGGYKLPETLRITIGDDDACKRLVAAVAEFKKGSSDD